MTRYFLITLSLLASLSMSASSVCAEGEAPASKDGGKSETASSAEAKPAGVELNSAASETVEADDYPRLLAKWQEVEKRLAAIEMDFYHTPSADRGALAKKFRAILDEEANPTAAKLRSAAMATYTSKPNEDESLVKLLAGMLISDARLGQEADAVELVLLLAEHKCDAKYIDALTNGRKLSPDALDMLGRLQKRFKDATVAPTEVPAVPK